MSEETNNTQSNQPTSKVRYKTEISHLLESYEININEQQSINKLEAINTSDSSQSKTNRQRCLDTSKCSYSTEESTQTYKYISIGAMCGLIIVTGLIRASFCWHQYIRLEDGTDGKAAQFQIFDLPLACGTFLVACIQFVKTAPFYVSMTLATCFICTISLVLGLLQSDLLQTIFMRFLLGMAMEFINAHSTKYLSIMMKMKMKKVYLFYLVLRNVGMIVGLAGTYLFNLRSYFLIFLITFICAFMFLCNVCLDITASSNNPHGVSLNKKVVGLLILFAFFFVLQGLFGSNLLLGYDNIISPNDFILFFLLYDAIDIFICSVKLRFFNFKFKLWIIYFFGIMLTVIGHCLLAMEKMEKIAIFCLFFTYNVFVDSLPEIGLGGLLQNDGEKIKLMLSKGIWLLSAVASKAYSILSSKSELKAIAPFVVIGIVVLNGLFHCLYRT